MRRIVIALTFAALTVTAYAQDRIWRAYPASACAIETDWPGDYQFHNAGGVRNVSSGLSGRSRRLHCPIISDSVLRQEDIAAIEVLVDDRSAESGVFAYICSQSVNAAPPCSRPVLSPNGRNVVNLMPESIAYLSSHAAGYFTELAIDIPKKSGDVPSSVIGIVILYSVRH